MATHLYPLSLEKAMNVCRTQQGYCSSHTFCRCSQGAGWQHCKSVFAWAWGWVQTAHAWSKVTHLQGSWLLGKGTRYLAFAVTHLAMTGPDSEERNRLFSRFAMGHKSRIGQCSEPVCVPDIASTGTGNSVWKPRYYYTGQLQPFSSSDL